MNTKLSKSFFTVMVIALFLCGCSTTYAPPEIPKHQLAYIKETKIENSHNRVVEIDNRIAVSPDYSPWNFNIFRKEVWAFVPKTYAIEPGNRVVTLRLELHGSIAQDKIKFTAQPGKTYYIQSDLRKREAGFWEAAQYAHFIDRNIQYAHFTIKEEQTDRIVAESPPLQPIK